MISLCDGWEFSHGWSEDFAAGVGEGEIVRLPHSVKETPLHYATPADYEGVYSYRRKLDISADYSRKRLFLQFDGAAQQAAVYVNGELCAQHRCGYTAFRVEITNAVHTGENTVAVRLDATEDPAIPPFGFVIDYLTYGGLYREVWLDVREQSFIQDIYITTPSLDTVRAAVTVCGEGRVRLEIYDGDRLLASAEGKTDFELKVCDVIPWDVDKPTLYTLRAQLLCADGRVVDTVDERFGFRTAEFHADGFYLNGNKLFLRGLNRHQCYPYIGYAAPESLQRDDARILKNELSCNAVRTSHYPQSRHFINACDELGLLVFTELPGWQHIGGDDWKRQALDNLRSLVLQYRNHPSIVLWGVRINESADDDEFYAEANAIAHELDASRATSGVRFIEKSHLLEDVYAYNDFSHSGANAGVRPKKVVTSDMSKALLISEHNGHMFPTKAFDPWSKRQEQALRHARVLDAAMADGDHGGCFGWCMFDYPTHKDFGSGDRVCYHGVLDAFRNPKLAAALYASQGEDDCVLSIGCPMDIGDYSAGNIEKIYAFTNADSVRLYKNAAFVAEFSPSGWKGLAHGPVLINDTIGKLLETQEGFTGRKAELLRTCLVSAGKHGLAGMPAADKLKMLWCMLRYKLSFADGVALYGKYVGNWGGEATRWRFEAIQNGKCAAERVCTPGSALHIQALCSSQTLTEGTTYDMSAVRIRLLDENGNVASYAQLPLSLSAEGDIELVGPKIVAAEGGMCGCYVRSLGRSGHGRLIIHCVQTADVEIEFKIVKKEI